MTVGVLLIAGLSTLVSSPAPPCSDNGFLYQPAFSVDHELRCPAHPYMPQPGDIYLSSEEWFLARLGHKLCRSGAPHHSGIIFAMPDGRMALLEGGPDSTLFVRILDLIPQMTFYANRQRVWIRQRCKPLTEEQSKRLTAFALAAADRPFAAVRMVLQVGPLKTKGLIRTPLSKGPYAACFDPCDPEPSMRKKYFCSELVTEACVAACLFDPVTSRPTSTYPRNLFFGDSRVPYLHKHLDMSDWLPPARWTPCPGTEPDLKPRPWLDGDYRPY